MKELRWYDETSESQRRLRRGPTVFAFEVEGARLVAHRIVHYPDDHWFWSCTQIGVQDRPLMTRTTRNHVAVQREALEWFVSTLRVRAEALARAVERCKGSEAWQVSLEAPQAP